MALGVTPLAPTADPDKTPGKEHGLESLHVPSLPREIQEQTGRGGCSLSHTGLPICCCGTTIPAPLTPGLSSWVSTGDSSP